MNILSLLAHTLLFGCLINICAAAGEHGETNTLERTITRELGSSSYYDHKPKPKPPPKKPSNSSSSSSSSASSSSSSSGGSTSSSPDTSPIVAPAKKSSAVKVSFGVAALGALIAAASLHQRRNVATRTAHPLEGSIAKRVENFEKFVGPHAENVRPTLDYNAMPESIEMV